MNIKTKMNMKKILAIICAALAVNMASAQPPMGGPGMGGGREQGPRKTPVERIAGLVEELQLTPEQAEKFAPVYLAYQGEIRKIRKDLKTLMDSYNGTSSVAFGATFSHSWRRLSMLAVLPHETHRSIKICKFYFEKLAMPRDLCYN